MLAAVEAMAGSLDAVTLDLTVIEEWMEQTHGVGAAADTGDERIRQATLGREHLLARFAADDRLKIADHHRVRVRSGDGADAIEGRADVGHPVAQRLVHRVLERPG